MIYRCVVENLIYCFKKVSGIILNIGGINFNKIRLAWFEISKTIYRVWSFKVTCHGHVFTISFV